LLQNRNVIQEFDKVISSYKDQLAKDEIIENLPSTSSGKATGLFRWGSEQVK